MSVSTHTISASMSVGTFYAAVDDLPVWSEDFSAPTLAWTGTTATLARTINASTGRAEMRITSTDGTTPFTGSASRTVTGLTIGKAYRITALVRAGWTQMSARVHESGGGPAYTTLSKATQSLVRIFTATATSHTIVIDESGTNLTAIMFVQSVMVHEVVLTSTLNLRPTQAQVTLDESWSPYARAVIECPIPPQDSLAKIDPRVERRVVLTLNKTDQTPPDVDLERVNLVTNPSFEVGVDPWVTSNGSPTLARVTSPAGQSGTACLQVTATSTQAAVAASGTGTAAIPVLPSTPYQFSAYVRAAATPRGAQVFVDWYNSTGTFLSSNNTSAVTDAVGSWTRVTRGGLGPATSPATAAFARIRVWWTTTAINEVHYVDSVLLEQDSAVGAYFDGDTTDVPPLYYAWTGTPHASTSTASTITVVAGSPSSRTFDLGLRSRSLDYVNGVMVLELGGDELLLQDYARWNTSPTAAPPVTTSLVTLVNWALAYVGLGSLAAGSLDATITESNYWEMGDSLWDTLDAHVSNAEYRLWCGEDRVWHLGLPLDGTSGSVTIGSLTVLTDVLSRTDWAEAVALGHDGVVGATPDDGPIAWTGASSGVVNKTYVVLKKGTVTPTAAAALALLARVKARGRRVSATAINDYGVNPGQTAYLSTPITTIDPVLLSAVTWDFPSDEMTITTRDLP